LVALELGGMLWTYVYFAVIETLLQILVDGIIRYFADESKIGHTDFLLLCRVECSLLDIGLTAAGRPGATARLRITGSFIALRSPTDPLNVHKNQL
jgi:hypothetical protein